MREFEYVKGGIYQDKYTPEKCMIMINYNNFWYYTYDLRFEENTILTNKYVRDIIEKNLRNTDFFVFQKKIPGVLPFFTDGYIGKIDEKLWKQLNNKLIKSNIFS